MTTLYNNYQKDEDDVALADIILLKISDEKKAANIMRNEQDIHNNVYQYQLQMQASYYQLQYIQQQQMMTLMRNSTTKRISRNSNRPPPISPSSSSSSLSGHRSNARSYPHTGSSQASQTMSITEPERSNLLKRKQSLGGRIKRIFGLKGEDDTTTDDNKPLKIVTSTPTGTVKSNHNSSSNIFTPDLPNSSVLSNPSHNRFGSPKPPVSPPLLSPQLPSPASSTVSFRKDRKLSFNPAVQSHETFSPEDYDRRSDVNSTCQKLTPLLALKIKEDLNNYKLKDMYVHPDSRHNTHFFM